MPSRSEMIQYVRDFLIRNGLAEELADAFIRKMKDDIIDKMDDEDERTELCRQIVRGLEEAKFTANDKGPSRLKRIMSIISAVIVGATGSALWDALKVAPQAVSDLKEGSAPIAIEIISVKLWDSAMKCDLKVHNNSGTEIVITGVASELLIKDQETPISTTTVVFYSPIVILPRKDGVIENGIKSRDGFDRFVRMGIKVRARVTLMTTNDKILSRSELAVPIESYKMTPL